jgi:hypothetical protein
MAAAYCRAGGIDPEALPQGEWMWDCKRVKNRHGGNTGLPFGVALGCVVGIAIGSLAIGVGGVAVGVGLGTWLWKRRR